MEACWHDSHISPRPASKDLLALEGRRKVTSKHKLVMTLQAVKPITDWHTHDW